MSMPSSMELVATTAGNRPAFRSSSMDRRRSFETDPWWARAITVSSRASADWSDSSARCAAASLSRAVRRSASRRELTNTMVDRCVVMMSRTRSATAGHTDDRSASPAALPVTISTPASSVRACPMSRKSSTGDSTVSSICLSIAGAITATPAGSVART